MSVIKNYNPKNLYEKRLVAGMNKAELARRSGVSRGTIHRIEKGLIKTEPLNSTYGGLAEAFDISPVEARKLVVAHIKDGD